MTEPTSRHPLTLTPIVFRLAGMENVRVRQDLPFAGANGDALSLDLYDPLPGRQSAPVVVIVEGFSDPGFSERLGCRFKDMASTTSLGRLIAASGMAAIAYTNRQPAADLQALLTHVREHSTDLNVDASRIGLWGMSGHGALALGALMGAPPSKIRCAVLSNPYTMDIDGFTTVADAAVSFRFVNGAAGRSVRDLPDGVPLFVARSGKDQMPGLNESLDRFVLGARAAGHTIEVADHPDAPHAFDLVDDSDVSRGIIERELAFLRVNL